MTRTVSTAIALTLGVAVLAAVAVTVSAQKKTAESAVSQPQTKQAEPAVAQAQTQQPAGPAAAQPQAWMPDGPDEDDEEDGRNSIRTGSLSISASEKTNPTTIKEEKMPEIEVDSSNVRTIPKSSVQPIRESKRELTLTSKLPAGSLAETLADAKAESVSVWRPAFATQGFRGTRLDAFALSDDGSVLAIAERTGTSLGPNGTRIVLIDTSNWQVIRIFTTELMLKKLAFGPVPETMAALAFPQASRKQSFGAALFNIKTGKQTAFYPLPFPFNGDTAPEQTALLTTSNGFFCSGFFGSKVFFIAKDADTSASVPYAAFETASPSSALAITPDGKSLAAVSRKAIEYFDLNPSNLFRRKSITSLDLGWAPVDLHFLGGAQTDFILCPAFKEDSPPVIMRSSARESLDGRSAGYAIPMDGGKQIAVAFKVKGRIDVIDPASLEAVDSVILEQLRPATAGDAQFVCYLNAIRAFCVIDTNGNGFAVGKINDSSRWAKRIIWNGGGKR